MVYHLLGMGNGTAHYIYAYLCLHVPTVDQTEVAYVAIMRVRIGVTIQARTVTRDSKRNITLREMHA